MEKDNSDKQSNLNESLKSLAESLNKIADTYFQSKSVEPKIPWYKFWKHKHFLPVSLIALAFFGYWLNWRGDIINAQIERLQDQIAAKQNKQEEIDAALISARMIVQNQMVLCGQTHESNQQKKVERNNALIKLITKTTGTRFIFNQNVQDKLNEVINGIYNIDDVCKLSSDQFELQQIGLYRDITNLINQSIMQEQKKLNKFAAQRHYEDIIADI